MIKITYPGTNNYSTFTYDPWDRNVELVETAAGTVTSTKQFVWSGSRRREARDGSGSVTAQFFDRGEKIGTSLYFYCLDHLDSVRQLLNSTGATQADYSFDPYGRTTKNVETVPSDFKFGGLYSHVTSGLNLGTYRAYNSSLGRWISRDPSTGYARGQTYADNDPVDLIDPLGLAAFSSTGGSQSASSGAGGGGGGEGPQNNQKQPPDDDPPPPGPSASGQVPPKDPYQACLAAALRKYFNNTAIQQIPDNQPRRKRTKRCSQIDHANNAAALALDLAKCALDKAEREALAAMDTVFTDMYWKKISDDIARDFDDRK